MKKLKSLICFCAGKLARRVTMKPAAKLVGGQVTFSSKQVQQGSAKRAYQKFLVDGPYTTVCNLY